MLNKHEIRDEELHAGDSYKDGDRIRMYDEKGEYIILEVAGQLKNHLVLTGKIASLETNFATTQAKSLIDRFTREEYQEILTLIREIEDEFGGQEMDLDDSEVITRYDSLRVNLKIAIAAFFYDDDPEPLHDVLNGILVFKKEMLERKHDMDLNFLLRSVTGRINVALRERVLGHTDIARGFERDREKVNKCLGLVHTVKYKRAARDMYRENFGTN